MVRSGELGGVMGVHQDGLIFPSKVVIEAREQAQRDHGRGRRLVHFTDHGFVIGLFFRSH